MIKTHWTALVCVGACLLASSVMATEQAGVIKVSNGVVTVQRGEQRVDGAVGVPVFVSDRIRTGADGAVGITLRDNTLLSAGPNSVLVIDKFAFDATTQAGAMSVAIRKGTLAVASGKIAKRTPDSVDFRTPTSILGVRGTEFVIEVAGAGDE